MFNKLFSIIVILTLLNCSCSHFIILHDPLTAEEHNDLGVAYWSENKLQAAEREFKKAIAKDKYYWLAYYNLGTILLEKNNITKSKEFLYKSITYNPEFADAYNNLAIAELKSKNKTRALYFIQLALRYGKEHRYKYLDTLASYYEQLPDLNQACAYYHQAAQLAPENEKNAYMEKYNSKCNNITSK
jgi:tetratricopeptide (TPR) repeat protein